MFFVVLSEHVNLPKLYICRSVNVPWPESGMGDAEYLHAFMKIVMPIAFEFAPDLVIGEWFSLSTAELYRYTLLVSAGFDAADGDELGQCRVTPAGYAHMTHMLSTLAGGKMVVALEVSCLESCF